MKERIVETKRIVERKLLERGWSVKFDYKRSIIETIGFTAQMFSFPEERQDFIRDAREVLEEQGLLSRKNRESREKVREENKKVCSEMEKAFLEAGWPLKIDNKDATGEIFFESQCRTLYDEERKEFINVAKEIMEKFKYSDK